MVAGGEGSEKMGEKGMVSYCSMSREVFDQDDEKFLEIVAITAQNINVLNGNELYIEKWFKLLNVMLYILYTITKPKLF